MAKAWAAKVRRQRGQRCRQQARSAQRAVTCQALAALAGALLVGVLQGSQTLIIELCLGAEAAPHQGQRRAPRPSCRRPQLRHPQRPARPPSCSGLVLPAWISGAGSVSAPGAVGRALRACLLRRCERWSPKQLQARVSEQMDSADQEQAGVRVGFGGSGAAAAAGLLASPHVICIHTPCIARP